MLISFIVICYLIDILNCQSTFQPDDYQSREVDLNISNEFFTTNLNNGTAQEEQSLAYGLWSKYAPLSQVRQVGNIGILDSNCFHYTNAADKESKRINMIYYDCLDYEKKTITKIAEFIDDQNIFHKFELAIKHDEYEGVWFLFYMIMWPQLSKFKMLVQGETGKSIYEELNLKYPFFDKKLTVKFGGELEVIIINNFYQAQYNNSLIRYSYFPGKLMTESIYDKFEIKYVSPLFNLQDLMQLEKVEQACNYSGVQLIDRQIFRQADKLSYYSQVPNQNYYQLSGWIRILQSINSKILQTYEVIKIDTALENNILLANDLSSFQMYYNISTSGNSITFTTYNYTFPSMNETYSISYQFDLQDNIYNWHYFSITLNKNQFLVEIEFFQDQLKQQYQKGLNIRQFSMINYYLLFGNLESITENHLQMEMAMVYFFICPSANLQKCLNQECSDCSGPNDGDCLNCFVETKKTFLPLERKCVCLFHTAEDGSCQDLTDLKLTAIQQVEEIITCPYGYFTVNFECYLCPSIIRQDQITCLECLTNPDTWIDMLYCSTQLTSQNNETYMYQQFSRIYYVFDGVEITPCNYCTNICTEDCIYSDYFTLLQSKEFINSLNFAYFQCNINGCQYCQFSVLKGNSCAICLSMFYLVNGECQFGQAKDVCIQNCKYCTEQICQICDEPFYLNHDKSQCKICPINNCKYCFEFNSQDRNKNTIFKEFEPFNIDEFFSIGCSLCNDGYNFDFSLNECIQGFPQITNCNRSFKEVTGEEKCLVSTVDNFNIAPQIMNCQGHIKNCEQCINTKSGIKCIICQPGFGSLQMNGLCDECQIENSSVCLQGGQQIGDYQVQLIQSFIIQFFSDSYYYPQTSAVHYQNYALSCIDGYQVNLHNGQCMQYCDNNCQNCQLNEMDFVCKQCPKNQFGLANLSNDGKNCLECSKLCIACRIRSYEEIYKINPFFVVTNENLIYTHTCLRALEHQKVKIDQHDQIAYYCFDQNCSRSLEKSFTLDQCIYYFDRDWEINTDFCNQMAITNLTLTVNATLLNCETIELINYYKSVILTLQESTIKFSGPISFPPSKNITFFNFDTIIFQQLYYGIPSGNSQLNFQNREKEMNLIIENTNFQGQLNQESLFRISLPQYKDLILNNITFSNLNLNNSIIFEYKSSQQDSKISITQIRIENCIFYNTTIFSFLTIPTSILVNDIIILNSNFTYSTFLLDNITSNQPIEINQMKISNCVFKISSVIQNMGRAHLQISQLNLSSNIFLSSLLVITDFQATLLNVQLINNTFIDSTFFISQNRSQTYELVYMNFKNLTILKNYFKKSKVIHIYKQKENKYEIKIENIIQEDLLDDSFYKINGSQTRLYYFSCFQISIDNVLIQQILTLQYFVIHQSEKIFLTNIIFKNFEQNFKISAIQSCNMQAIEKSPILIKVIGFSELSLNNISILNQLTIDKPMIDIQSYQFTKSSSKEIIRISNLFFQSNILLKYNLAQFFSLIVIYSQIEQLLYFQNVSFYENSFHQIIDDPLQTTAGLLYLNSFQSNLYIVNLTCQYNSLTNSSSSFVYLNSIQISINDLTIINHNLQTREIWQKYYQIQLDFFQEEFYGDLMDQVFGIKTIRGLLDITSSQLIISNAKVSQVLAQNSAVFRIQTQGQGIIKIFNLSITNVFVKLKYTGSIDGCISIFSVQSLLQLQLENILFEEILNRFGTAILTIDPSLKKNIILLKNITMTNCFSLLNQFMKVKFTTIQEEQNLVILENLKFYQSADKFEEYLLLITFPSISENRVIDRENAFVNLQSCSVKIHNFQVQGIIISPILVINDAKILIIKLMIIEQVQVLYFFAPFQFSFSPKIQPKLCFEDIFVNRMDFTYYSENIPKILYEYIYQNHIQHCMIFPEIQIKVDVNQTIDSFLLLKQRDSDQKISIFKINLDSILSEIYFKNIMLFNNYCMICNSGLFSINQIQSAKVTLFQFICFQNVYLQPGCLYLQTYTKFQEFQWIIIQNSKFLQNYDTGLFFIFVPVKLSNSLFKLNKAQYNGGAILAQQAYNFSLKNTFIINNYAEGGGGGIYFMGEHQYFTKQNIIQSSILFNAAQEQSNNVNEVPDHLELEINNQKMNSILVQQDGSQIYSLELKKYRFIEQQKIMETSYLFLPSNERVNNYKRFNEKTQVFERYLEHFSLSGVNYLGEKQAFKERDSCQLLFKEAFENYTEMQQSQSKNETIYTFQQNFSLQTGTSGIDLGYINITFDPYQREDKFLLIQITCYLGSDTPLNYQIKAKSFKCQQGEFYINNGCQQCDPIQGLYSVEYDVVKCSNYDINKLENITSNQLKLREGYWRPHYHSNYIENCYNNPKFCIGGWEINYALCMQGHIGGLCEECDSYNVRGDGNFVKMNNQECEICNILYSILPFILIVVWSFVSIVFNLRSIRRTNNTFKTLKITTQLYPILFKLNQDFQGIFFKMLLNYIWLFSVIFSFHSTFSFSQGTLNSIASPNFQMATNFDCLIIQLWNNPLIYMRLMFTCTFLVAQFFLLILGFKIYFHTEKINFDFSVIFNIFIYLYVSNQTQLIKSFSSIISIRTISDIDYVYGDVSLIYDDFLHMRWVYSIIPCLIITGFIIPLFFFILLIFNKKNFQQTKYRKRYGFLFNEYNQSFSYWEQIKIVSRSMIIIIISYFEANIYIKGSLISISLIGYKILVLKYQPYVIKSLNNLDSESNSAVLICALLAMMEYVSEQQNNQILSTVLQMLILAIFARIVYCFVTKIMYIYYKMHKLMILQHLSNFSFKYFQNTTFCKYLQKQYAANLLMKENLKNNYDKIREWKRKQFISHQKKSSTLKNVNPAGDEKKTIKLLHTRMIIK